MQKFSKKIPKEFKQEFLKKSLEEFVKEYQDFFLVKILKDSVKVFPKKSVEGFLILALENFLYESMELLFKRYSQGILGEISKHMSREFSEGNSGVVTDGVFGGISVPMEDIFKESFEKYLNKLL